MSRERPKTFGAHGDPLDKVSEMKPLRRENKSSNRQMQEIANDVGFTSREVKGMAAFDARSLRATNRTAQLNISVKTETKTRFWRYAQENGFTVGEDALLHLLKKATR
ncbi:hypothetical protein [Phycobacter azelaicus]|uniref:hypothetical protein n=1 Tax=Phycobacter azelaicus TaxID=2668075 RepID=UPI0018679DC1|nr:hypothetical protein [Phycobacter azelaicus]